MNKKPFESKKFIAMVIAIAFTTIFTSISLIIIAMVPTAASSVVNLMTVTLAAVNGAISMYSLGQSAVDWKINSSNKNELEHSITEEYKRFEMQYEE
jgi:membrane protein YqaA with SNARE-associated domain